MSIFTYKRKCQWWTLGMGYRAPNWHYQLLWEQYTKTWNASYLTCKDDVYLDFILPDCLSLSSHCSTAGLDCGCRCSHYWINNKWQSSHGIQSTSGGYYIHAHINLTQHLQRERVVFTGRQRGEGASGLESLLLLSLCSSLWSCRLFLTSLALAPGNKVQSIIRDLNQKYANLYVPKKIFWLSSLVHKLRRV